MPNPKFPSSLTLSLSDLRSETGREYWYLVGILGAPDSGKTAALVSLYLLLARNSVDGFSYANSLTIRAFDQISRGARRWNEGQPPAQLTSHTESPDERAAGFLHLRVRDRNTNTPFDVLLPDLPGEWSTSLIDNNRADRLAILKAADAIWIVVDGQQLIKVDTRQLALHRVKLIIQRLATLLGEESPSLILVVSRRDLGMPNDVITQELCAEAVRYGMIMTVVHISSFSDHDEVKAGTGISELVETSLCPSVYEHQTFWPDGGNADASRAFLNFRSRRESRP